MKKRIVLLLLMAFVLLQAAYAKSGSMKLLAVSGSEENPQGSIANIFLEIKDGSGRVYIDSFPLSKIDTQISTRFAKEVACSFLERDCSAYDFYYTIRANSAIIGGPSAGAATAVLTVSVLEDLPIDEDASMTGTINTGGIIGPVGGIFPKIEAAAESGLKKVLIPKYSQINGSNISEYEEKYNVKVIEVSQLKDAIKELTGKDYSEKGDLNISGFYVETMKSISEDLCKRAEDMSLIYGKENVSALDLLDQGKLALASGEYYSAASYCFGSGLGSQYKGLQEKNLNDEQVREKINEMIDRVNDLRNSTQKKSLKTITDLETYMVVTDRLIESRDRLNDAIFYLAKNDTNSSLYNLAYGIERLNSAVSWSVFFGKPGRSYDFNKKIMDESCLKKISEVEERIQYLELYLPSGTEDLKLAVKKSYEDYNSGNPELCLYKSSIAKSKVDSILNTIAIDSEDIDKVIEDRSGIVKSILAKQSSRGAFPIVAYSYYEYAQSLKARDKYSALLYLEYALELGNLDIYFERQKIPLPKVANLLYVSLFASGLFIGLAAGIAISKIRKKRR